MKVHAQKQSNPQQQASRSVPSPSAKPLAASHPILYLQRTIGNRAVQRMLQASAEAPEAGADASATTHLARVPTRISMPSPAPAVIQPKLTVNTPGHISGQAPDQAAEAENEGPVQLPGIQQKSLAISDPNDPDEKEADEAARKVVGGQSAEIHGTGGAVNRSGEGSAETTRAFQSKLESSKGSGQPLGDSIRGEMESKMGADFGGVKIHTGNEAHALNESISAKAFTHGKHIYFRDGTYSPGSQQGRELLAHELVHTVQQAGGKVRPKIQRQYGGGNAKETNPKAIIPISDLINYIRAVEKAYPKDNYQEILARLRILYYDSIKFRRLIPESPIYETKEGPNYDAPWKTAEKTHVELRGIFKADKDAYEHLTAHADENPTKEKKGDNPSPYIKLNNGEEIDFGHLLLGLDALIHPATKAPYTTYEIPNEDVATHVADLGIAVVWMTYHETKGEPHADAPKHASGNLDEYYKMSAPEQDLLGDVDAFALYQSAGKRNAELSGEAESLQKLSDIIEYYYSGQKENKYSVDQRWRSFMVRNGWGDGYTVSDGSVTLKPNVRATLLKKVKYFADLYDDGLLSAVEAATPFKKPERRSWKHADAVVDKFLSFVKKHLEQEIAKGKAQQGRK